MTIAQIKNKWYVVKTVEISGITCYSIVSMPFDTAYQAREELFRVVFHS